MSSIQNRQDFRKNWGWALSAGIGMLPVIGTAYDIACLAFERDLITGEKLSDAEKLLIMAGLIGGLIEASFLDEAFDLSSELLKNVSRVDDLADAAKGGKAIGHLDEVADAAKGLGHLDEVMEAAKNLDNVDDALDIAKNLDNLDNALDATKNLDEAADLRLRQVTDTSGNQLSKRGDDLRQSLGRSSQRGGLSRRWEQAGVNQRLREVSEASTGRPLVKSGDELRAALTNVRSGVTLKERRLATRAWKRAGADLNDPAVRQAIRNGEFPSIRGGNGAFDEYEGYELVPRADDFESKKRTVKKVPHVEENIPDTPTGVRNVSDDDWKVNEPLGGVKYDGGIKTIFSTVEGLAGSTGSFMRGWDESESQRQLIFKMGYRGKLPKWVKHNFAMSGKGTPTGVFFTMHQMKRLEIPKGSAGLKWKISQTPQRPYN